MENGNAFISPSLSPTTAFLMWRLEDIDGCDLWRLSMCSFTGFCCSIRWGFEARCCRLNGYTWDRNCLTIYLRWSEGVDVDGSQKMQVMYLVVTTHVITWIVYGFLKFIYFHIVYFTRTAIYSWSLLELCQCHGWCNSRPFTVFLRR